MPSLGELRQQYPQYNDLPDDKFVGGFYDKFYSDMPREEFNKRLGYEPREAGSSPLHDFLFGGSTGPGGTIARATQNLPGSVEGVATGLWNAITHPSDTAKSLWDEASSGFPALRERYGSVEKFQKTFEDDPAGTMLDAATLGKGGSALVRKGAELGARGARAALPTIGSATSKASAADLRTAGEAGLRGGAEGAEYQAGAAGKPLTSEIKPRAAEADPLPPDLDLGGIKASKVVEAQKALAAQREAEQAKLAPYGQAGRRIGAAGADPTSIVIGGLAGGRLGTAAAATAASPRAMGTAMYGLGAAERRLAGGARPATREAIAAGAAALLKDREAKQGLPPADVKTLRAATRSEADSSTMLAASRILGSRPSPYGGSDIAQYGGIGGDRPTAPSPGQASTPTGGAGAGTGPAPAPSGPGPAGAVNAGPGASPAAAGGPLPLPGQSPGLSRLPTTGQKPVAATHGGQTLMQFMWDKMLKGSKDLSADLKEAGRSAFFEPEKFDPKAPLTVAGMMMGGGMPFAGRGQAGVGGGKLMQPPTTAPPFYSAVADVVQGASQAKASGGQWAGMIKNAPGVKPEELQWLGLEDWLKEQGNRPVTKQELGDYVRANQVELKEITKGAPAAAKTKIDQFDPGSPEYHRALDEINQPGMAPKFSSYQLPGGENYREMLLTLPTKKTPVTPEATESLARTLYETYERRGGDPPWERIAPDVQQIYRQRAEEKSYLAENPGMYRSSHWDEPNVLAHVRFNDRNIDGKKTLLLEEVQSDWHQQGKRKGYKTADLSPAEQAELNSLIKMGPRVSEDPATYDRYSELMERAGAEEDRVPDAPFKTTWPELALKRMLRYASEHGYDKIAWTPGEVQAARYDLSKHISRIEYKRPDPNSEGGSLTAYGHGNAGAQISGRYTTVKDLPDVIGKEAADKLLNAQARQSGGTYNHVLRGLDLKIGGEGMKGFYDKMLPAMANKLGKKFGAKVGVETIDAAAKDASGTMSLKFMDPAAKQQIWTMDITPVMRKAAMEKGFPLFQSGLPVPTSDQKDEPARSRQ
jgi:hypothetical protein